MKHLEIRNNQLDSLTKDKEIQDIQIIDMNKQIMFLVLYFYIEPMS